MKFRAWIKKIVLFPMFVMMGIPEGLDAAAVGDAGDGAVDADQQGNQGEGAEDEGVDPLDDESDPDADQDADSDADDTARQEAAKAEEEKKTGIVQKTLEERAAEIAEKKVQEALAKQAAEQAELQRQAEERLKAAEKPFIDLSDDQLSKLNNDYAAAFDRKLDLQESYRLSEDQAEKGQILAEIRRIEKWIGDTERWYADNEAKKSEWTKKNKETEAQAAQAKERADRLAAAADVYRESKNIPEDVWEQSGIWFMDQIKSDKLLALQYQDAYRLQGDVGAIDFAYKYCLEHMGKESEAALKQKEEAKKQLTPGVTSVVQKVNANPELKALLQKAQKSGTDEDYLAYVEAARKAGVKR